MNKQDLSFRIISVLDGGGSGTYSANSEKQEIERHMATLKSCVEMCGLTDVVVKSFKMEKSEDEDYPEIEECMFQVNAKCGKSGPQRKSTFFYKEFLSSWKNLLRGTLEKSISTSVLVFNENAAFNKFRQSYHPSVDINNIAFGTLPFNGKFLEFARMGSCYGDFSHDLRQLKLRFTGGVEMVLPYNNIKNIFVNIDTNPMEIFFDVVNPPVVFFAEQKRNRYESYVINRRTCCLPKDDTYLTPISVDVFGRSNVLRLSFRDPSVATAVIDRIHFRCGEKPIFYATIHSIRNLSIQTPNIGLNNHFGCTYLLHAIFQRNFTMVSQITVPHVAMERLNTLCSENSDCLEKSLTLVLAALDSGKVVNMWYALERQFQYYQTHRDEIDFDHYVVPEKCRKIRRVTVTPTRKLFWAPEIMFGNRVLRNFDSEYALRIAFRDDNNSRLSFNAAFATDDFLDLSIKKPMTNGILIGSRHYQFLAWSNSQIRVHGVWMYARDTSGNTVSEIRSWMGDFSHIHSVPKYMSRMGQCFSQTEDALSVPLEDKHVRTEEDIERGSDPANGYKPYCFSDGVGKISQSLAKKVHDALGHDKLCSAFQIRYGGCKGMLVIDPTLKDTDIVFRKSMKKFNSPRNIRLEIAKTSAPISLQLNRPFITLLNDLGVRHRTFMKLQENILQTLTEILFDEEKAFRFLESKTPSEIFEYKQLSRSGIYLTDEPFFRSLLLALHRHHIEKIKNKANIPIETDKGRNMLGVMDETGLLEQGQVFIQYTKDISRGETTRDTKILNRQVLVTKNPCLLPGDVRKFRAVDIKELHHIVDCIVFPQRGSRPHPNEMGGSDLDGDEYAVLWDDDLIFYNPNHSPGHFPSASAEVVMNIRDHHMIDFLAKYIKYDQVGGIANAHLARADSENVFSDECVSIAKKFSYAVDFAKTGVIKNLEPVERPQKFPDFMEKNHKETYRSEKALGKMFRVARDYESENENASMCYQDIKVDPDLMYPGWERYKDDAIKSRNKFNTLLRTILRNYGIQHESEVFSGAFTQLHCRFHERKDRDEIEKVVVRCIKRLSKSLREEFLEEFTECANFDEMDSRLCQKASAWYIVTYSDPNAKFLSFPWTVSKYLANIKIRKHSNVSYFSPIVERMDREIKICEDKGLLPYFPNSDIWRGWVFQCDSSVVQRALRVLMLWAEDEEIIQKPGIPDTRGFIYVDNFVRLFLHIAEQSKYIVKKACPPPTEKMQFSSAALCLEFFRFCLKLRFYNKHEVPTVLPFNLYKYNWLSKRAVVTYHTFALLGKFRNLYFGDSMEEENTIQMKPININSKTFSQSPIPPDVLRKAEECLQRHSGAEVDLREILQTKKVLVSATGTEQSLKNLKCILRKKDIVLKHLFLSGELLEN